MSAVVNHIDGIATFPFAGRARDDVRPGMRTFKKRTIIAYVVEAESDARLITILASSTVGRTGNSP